MSRRTWQLLRSVYRLLNAAPNEGTAPAWAALREEIETHLIETWEPVTFITVQSSINATTTTDADTDKDEVRPESAF